MLALSASPRVLLVASFCRLRVLPGVACDCKRQENDSGDSSFEHLHHESSTFLLRFMNKDARAASFVPTNEPDFRLYLPYGVGQAVFVKRMIKGTTIAVIARVTTAPVNRR